MAEAAARERRGTRSAWGCSEAAPPELAPGTVVGQGRYVVGTVLGRGGMATVHCGHDQRLGRDVALKVMRGDAAGYRVRAQRFEHEVGLVARLPEHPGLLRPLHAGRLPELGERPFLVSERVPGPTLAFRLAAVLRMPPWQVVHLGLGLAEGLVAVHGVGLVHRDLTARNVLLRPIEPTPGDTVDDDGTAQPVLVDFGVAASIERGWGARLTRADQRPGTLHAMAPEQYRGARPHPAMDVYALGRLLFQMLTGDDPHAMVPYRELLERHRDGMRVAPRLDGEAEAPSSLGALIDACTEPEPRRRPSAEEVCGELRALAAALGEVPAERSVQIVVIEAPRSCDPLPPAGARPRSARRWGVAAMVVAAGLAMLAEGLRPDTEQRTKVMEASIADDDGAAAVAWPSTVVPWTVVRTSASTETDSEPAPAIASRQASTVCPPHDQRAPSHR